MLLREAWIEISRRILITSMRCWILRPDGPAAILLGNECKMTAMLKFKPRGRGMPLPKLEVGDNSGVCL